MKLNAISEGPEWSFELIEQYDQKIAEIAQNFELDIYPNQIEIITAEQMMNAYSSAGMPVGYSHWSFGKRLVRVERNYRRGRVDLAYELVINSNPCMAYLMEENTMMMQALVIAHACYGHNSFFKGNYLFREWTSPEAIIDYLVFAKKYVTGCEERYGHEEVEQVLDACHALMNYGVDRYKRPSPLSAGKENARHRALRAQWETELPDAEFWRHAAPDWFEKQEQRVAWKDEEVQRWDVLSEPQENILYFLEKHALFIPSWKRELIRIVRKLAQYFYPQRQTQVMNEGWACFWHYTILNELYDRGLVTDGFMIEFLQAHTSVIAQLPFDHPLYSGINPYALGFAMMRDIKRICEDPTEEDRWWFPDIAGSSWRETLDFAMRNFKDESFIAQFLSPKLIRDFKLFGVLDDDEEDKLEVTAIHNEEGYRRVRSVLAAQHDLGSSEPDIQIHHVDMRGDRSLTLRHTPCQGRPLHGSARRVVDLCASLWGADVSLETLNGDGEPEMLCTISPQEVSTLP